jgi:hypothetical protein
MISQAGSAKKLKLIRFLRQFIGHGRCLTMSVQEKQADEVSIKTARSVHRQGHKNNWVWTVQERFFLNFTFLF